MIRNEALELLLSAARWAMKAEDDLALDREIARVKDWDVVIEAASQHGVIPLIARALRDREAVPLPIRRELYRRYFENSSCSALLSTELRALLAAFHDAGLDVLAYKGPAFAAMAYGDITLRHPSGDLDLLLRRSDINRAKTLIQARGYALLAPDSEQHFLKHRYHLHYERRNPEIHVELHWALTPVYWPFQINSEHLWERAHEVSISGGSMRTLNPECALLALCGHGAKEGWPRLSQILDLGRLIQSQPDLDWNWVLDEARRMRRERVLRLGLWLVTELIGARIPDRVAAEVRKDDEVPRLGSQIRDSLVMGRLCGTDFHRHALCVWNHASDRLGYLGYLCRLLPEKIHAIVKPSGTDRDFMDLGELPSFLYTFIRPLRVMYQYRDLRLMVRKLMKNL